MFWEKEIQRCEETGLEAPDPIPHPDDIIVDIKTGRVEIREPMTPEERPAWDKLREQKAKTEDLIVKIKAARKKNPHDAELVPALKTQEKLKERFSVQIPDKLT